jgi:hypothetical protein
MSRPTHLIKSTVLPVLVGPACLLLGASSVAEKGPPQVLRLSIYSPQTDLLPYEPLLLGFKLENRSQNASLSLYWDSGDTVRFEYHASTGWKTLPRYETNQRVRTPLPLENLLPGRSFESRRAFLCVAPRRDAAPLFGPGTWLVRAAYWPSADVEIKSAPLTIKVAEPDWYREFDAFWELRDSIDPTPGRHRDNPVFLLLPREGVHLVAEQRSKLTGFVDRHPDSRYSLYFRNTFVAKKDGSYTEEENGICERYRIYLRKHAASLLSSEVVRQFGMVP